MRAVMTERDAAVVREAALREFIQEEVLDEHAPVNVAKSHPRSYLGRARDLVVMTSPRAEALLRVVKAAREHRKIREAKRVGADAVLDEAVDALDGTAPKEQP